MLRPSYIVNRTPGPLPASATNPARPKRGRLKSALRPGGRIIAAGAWRQPCYFDRDRC